jgi:peptidoglycan/LPS O-acetylase OafA/YrhL
MTPQLLSENIATSTTRRLGTADHSRITDFRADVDGLRGVAILLVVLFHAFPAIVPGGFIGVDVFFVISGFLITRLVWGGLEGVRFTFRTFYARRIRRLGPALIIVLVASLVFGWFALLADEYMQLGKHVAAGGAMVANFAFWSEVDYFDRSAETKPLLHLWSLGIEEQFYLFWPAILWLLFKLRIHPLKPVLALGAVSFAVNALTIENDPTAAFYSPYTRAWELLAGAALALSQMPGRTAQSGAAVRGLGTLRRIVGERSSDLMSVVGLLLIGISAWFVTKRTPFPGWAALAPTGGTALVLLAGSATSLNRTLLGSRYLVWLGAISYPLYLWHWPLLSFGEIVATDADSAWFRLSAVFLACALAWITYRCIETPARFGRWPGVWTRALVGSAVLVIAAGGVCFAYEGFEARSSVQRFLNNKNELVRLPKIDDECVAYSGKAPTFPYCRFFGQGGSQTVALIGDSHAHVAFPGIVEVIRQADANVVSFANSGCPPFVGGEYGANPGAVESCREQTQHMLDLVTAKSDIQRVFVFSRGSVYLTGKYYGDAEDGTFQEPPIPPAVFKQSLQRIIAILRDARKHVFYVAENPELPMHPSKCVVRPMRLTFENCDIARQAVLSRQSEYLRLLTELKDVTVIQTIPTFCDDDQCYAFSKGTLLYADFNHLSLAGSRRQAEQALAPFLLDTRRATE